MVLMEICLYLSENGGTTLLLCTWLNNVCGRLDPFLTRSVVKWKLESGLLCCFYVCLRPINNNTIIIHSLYDFGEFSIFSRNTCMYLCVCHLSHFIERPLYELRSSFTDWVHLCCKNDSKFRPFLLCLEFAFHRFRAPIEAEVGRNLS